MSLPLSFISSSETVLIALFAVAAFLGAHTFYTRLQRQQKAKGVVAGGKVGIHYGSTSSPSTGTNTPTDRGSGWLKEAPDGRKWGHWIPSKFRMPPIPASEGFDIKTAKAPLYRAFKYKHTVIMDARAMPWEAWVELDSDFPRYHALRTARVAERGTKLYGCLPGAEQAVRELCLELAEFLVARYPMVYSVQRRKGKTGSWFNEPNEIRSIRIIPFDVTYDLDEEDPMKVAGLLSPVDLAVMMEGEDSLYYMKAGFVALAGSWRYEDKIGKDLYGIHTSGHVPEYKQKLDLPMTRYHQRLLPENPGWRNNYTVAIDHGKDELAWSTSTKGPEEVFDQATKGPHPSSIAAKTFVLPQPITDPTQIQIRQERQTLRRLPRTGAIIFTVHSYSEPITTLVEEPGVPGRLASVIGSWKGEVDMHKNGALFKDLLIPYLSKKHKEQVAAGLTPEGQDPEWKYPY